MGTAAFMYGKLFSGFLPIVESGCGKSGFSFLAEGKQSMIFSISAIQAEHFLSSGTDRQPRI